ncbi:MAG: nucleotidyltransferase family protein [bacterium]
MQSLISLLNVKEPAGILDWKKILLSARYHKVSPLLFYKIKDFKKISVPCDIYLYLEKTYKINSIRNTFILDEFEQIRSSFQKENIPVILLKGIFFLHTVYNVHIGTRRMEDVDILIREEDVERADGVLKSFGYIPPCGGGYRKVKMYFKHEKDRPVLAPLHLHWHIVNLSGDFIELNWPKINIPEIWQFAKPADKEKNIYIMSPEYMLLSLCEHGLRHGFCRINIIYDIHSYVTRYKNSLDWDKLQNLSCSWNLIVPLYLGLFLSNEMFYTGLPEKFLNDLRPEGISLWEKCVINYIRKSRVPNEDICILLYMAVNKKFSDKARFIFTGLSLRLNN